MASIATLLAGVVLAVSLILVFSRGLEKRRTAQVLNKFKDRAVYGVSSNANCFGQQSLGIGQTRGNGVLVLADGELYFEMWLPKRQLSIPFARLSSIETTKSHLGKSKSRPLLKVSFKNESGQEDSVAWLVGNLEHWQSALQKVIDQKA